VSAQRNPSGAERFLRLFTDIRAGEAGTALLLTANVFLRAGDVFSAGLVYVGSQLLALSPSGFAMVNVALVTVWLVLAFWTGRENAKVSAATAV